jgi:hypothetical protein
VVPILSFDRNAIFFLIDGRPTPAALYLFRAFGPKIGAVASTSSIEKLIPNQSVLALTAHT